MNENNETQLESMIDMRKQYRDELHRLRQEERRLRRHLAGVKRSTVAQIQRLEVSALREERGVTKILDRINRRRGILEGRLA